MDTNEVLRIQDAVFVLIWADVSRRILIRSAFKLNALAPKKKEKKRKGKERKGKGRKGKETQRMASSRRRGVDKPGGEGVGNKKNVPGLLYR